MTTFDLPDGKVQSLLTALRLLKDADGVPNAVHLPESDRNELATIEEEIEQQVDQ